MRKVHYFQELKLRLYELIIDIHYMLHHANPTQDNYEDVWKIKVT